MASIGTFKKTGTEYTGEIFTLSLQAKGVRLVPDRASGEVAETLQRPGDAVTGSSR